MNESPLKIAIVTDDMKTVSARFETASHYIIFVVENGVIVTKEERTKAQEHQLLDSEHNIIDLESDLALAKIVEPIMDCSVLLARGMGRIVYDSLSIRSIQPVLCESADIKTAIQDYLIGKMVNHLEYLY